MSHYKPEEMAALSRYLKDANFPATRKSIMELAVENGAPERSLEALAKIPDRDYIHLDDVVEQVGSLHK